MALYMGGNAYSLHSGVPAGGGGSAVIQTLSVTENGTYTAPAGVDGYSPVVVAIPVYGGEIS